MTKQEEIKEGAIISLMDYKGFDRLPTEYIIDYVLNYLHSQGVVIKVDRELPYSLYASLAFESKEKDEIKDNLEKNSIYEEAQIDILEAGYVAVENLIEEEHPE